MNLKTLEEHNQERRLAHRDIEIRGEPHPNGIACPECGKELLDTIPSEVLSSEVLSSNPLQKNVRCPACGWWGYRLA